MSQALDAIVLKNACALLASEHRWTSGAWAREARGNRCSPLSQNAVRWCAVGALQKCAYDLIGNGVRHMRWLTALPNILCPDLVDRFL